MIGAALRGLFPNRGILTRAKGLNFWGRVGWGGGMYAAGQIGGELAESKADLLRSYYGDEQYEARFGTAGETLANTVRTLGVVGGALGVGFAAGPLDIGVSALRVGTAPVSAGLNIGRGVFGSIRARHRLGKAGKEFAGASRSYWSKRAEFTTPTGAAGIRYATARSNYTKAQTAYQSTQAPFTMGVRAVGSMGKLAGKGMLYMGGPAAIGAHIGNTTPRAVDMPAEGTITDVGRGSIVNRMNFSTAGLVQALHQVRRTEL